MFVVTIPQMSDTRLQLQAKPIFCDITPGGHRPWQSCACHTEDRKKGSTCLTAKLDEHASMRTLTAACQCCFFTWHASPEPELGSCSAECELRWTAVLRLERRSQAAVTCLAPVETSLPSQCQHSCVSSGRSSAQAGPAGPHTPPVKIVSGGDHRRRQGAED